MGYLTGVGTICELPLAAVVYIICTLVSNGIRKCLLIVLRCEIAVWSIYALSAVALSIYFRVLVTWEFCKVVCQYLAKYFLFVTAPEGVGSHTIAN